MGLMGRRPRFQDFRHRRRHQGRRRIRDWGTLHLQEVKRLTFEMLADGGWKEVYSYPKGGFILTPQLPEPEEISSLLESDEETITLVPYGCTRLRLGVFSNANRSLSRP